MAVKQTMIDFHVVPDASGDWMKHVAAKLEEILKTFLLVDKPVFSSSTVILFEGQHGLQCTVRLFPDGLVSLDVMQDLKNLKEENILKRQDYIDLRDRGSKALPCIKADYIPTLSRGEEILRYHDTSDEQIKEYDFDREVLKGRTQYQDVWIVHSPQYGNMLFLDSEEMLAESDIDYTRALLGNGRENYKDKTVLILGGGDGGVLNELLKESPRYVTMIEIDEGVINAAVKFLRGICGSSMDSYTGKNYEIRVGDCVQAMKEFAQEGRTFDFVINDLTDIPISVTSYDSHWDFVREILNLTLRVLTPKGKFYAQGTNGATQKKAIEQYEKQLLDLCYPVEFRREFVFVPSFKERHPFCWLDFLRSL